MWLNVNRSKKQWYKSLGLRSSSQPVKENLVYNDIGGRQYQVSKMSRARSLSQEVVLRAATIRSMGKPRSLNCRIIPILVSAFEIALESGLEEREPRPRLSTLDLRLLGSSCSFAAFSNAISASSPGCPPSSSFCITSKCSTTWNGVRDDQKNTVMIDQVLSKLESVHPSSRRIPE